MKNHLPSEIIKTLTAYRCLIGKVQVLLQRQGIKLTPLGALSLASLPPEPVTIRTGKRLGLILGANPYNTVETLHKAGLVRCSEGGRDNPLLMVDLTSEGAALGDAVRKALGGEDVAKAGAAE
jgi:hypothetical protein